MSVGSAASIDAVLSLVEKNRLRIPIDAAVPETGFPFTAAGVAAALRLQASGHSHGKVVVDVALAAGAAALAAHAERCRRDAQASAELAARLAKDTDADDGSTPADDGAAESV